MKRLLFLLHLISFSFFINAENGYDLWLRYAKFENTTYAKSCHDIFSSTSVVGTSPTISILKEELSISHKRFFNEELEFKNLVKKNTLIIAPISQFSFFETSFKLNESTINDDGFIIKSNNKQVIVTAKTDIGLLYGTYHLLRLMQTEQDLSNLNVTENPKLTHRLLNHWDNLDRTVERGYAGFSIWDWHKLPHFIDQRYIDYARANASIGINGTVLTNVNANALVLTEEYIEKAKALADVFRPYGIKVYLTARFSAPIEIGGLKTADPLNKEVQQWWNNKAKEIYKHIPDFGGFAVKANSEGQPGPQDYHRSHADGANMLAKAIAPFGGFVMWRAFVYSDKVPEDRAKQAYTEFMALDDVFEDNVFIQVKNGPLDFQPREPFHPLFGAMKQTPLMMEFQITQEYLGCATHLTYLAPLFKEALQSDTYAKGQGSTVAKAIDGSLYGNKNTGMAGVSNIGTDINWTGHPFGQANWYALGRLAWNHELTSDEIADEWLRMTFSNKAQFLNTVKPMMFASREAAVNYRTPFGLQFLMANIHHWGPGPWVDGMRPDWTAVYYHRADSFGIGFDRSTTGSKATYQYFPEVKNKFDNIETCPEELLLYFHHVSWNHKMKSGKTLWNALIDKYYTGANTVKQMQSDWSKVEQYVDKQRFNHVKQLLSMQADEAIWWRNACLLYFQQFSKQTIPSQYEQPNKTLKFYQNQKFHFVPGIFH